MLLKLYFSQDYLNFGLRSDIANLLELLSELSASAEAEGKISHDIHDLYSQMNNNL